MKLIDANVFIHAAGTPHSLREPSRRVLADAWSGAIDANTNTEVFREILHYYRIRRDVEFGREVFHKAINIFPSPLEVTVAHIHKAADILVEHPHLQARDAIHAAVVLEDNLEGIISADRGFDVIPGVTRFDPASL